MELNLQIVLIASKLAVSGADLNRYDFSFMVGYCG